MALESRLEAVPRTEPLCRLARVLAEEDALHLAEHLELEVHHVRGGRGVTVGHVQTSMVCQTATSPVPEPLASTDPTP